MQNGSQTPSGSMLAHPAVRIAAWACGIGLIFAAAWMVWRDPAFSGDAWTRVRGIASSISAVQVVALLCLPLLSLGFTTACFWHLMRPHGKVGFGEMGSLIAASWVLNLLPLKPGLVGRVVYHARINQIPATTSVRVLLEASGCGIVGVLLLSGLLIRSKIGLLWFDSAMALAWLSCLSLGIWGWIRPAAYIPRLAGATLFRALDAFTWVLRYGVLFSVMGMQVPIESAAVIAAGAQAASYVPLVGNGLGVREWVVALLWKRIGPASELTPIAAGLSADLVNRILELIVLGPVGALAVWLVARRMRTAGANHTPS